MKEIEILKNLADSPLIHNDVKAAVEKAIGAMNLLEGLRIYMGADFPKQEALSRKSKPEVAEAPVAAEKAEAAPKADSKPAANAKPITGAGARWTPEEDEKLKAEFNSGLRATEMAAIHGRSVPSILIRLSDKLQLITEEQKKELLSKFYNRDQGKDASATPAPAQEPAPAGSAEPEKSTQADSSKVLSPEKVEERMPDFIQNPY